MSTYSIGGSRQTAGDGSPGYLALRDFLLCRMRMSYLYEPMVLVRRGLFWCISVMAGARLRIYAWPWKIGPLIAHHCSYGREALLGCSRSQP